MLGHGALKYFILRVDPKKRMMFNPEESIDFNGNTGPFIQYAHARIRAIERKASADPSWLAEGDGGVEVGSLGQREREVLHQLSLFPEVVDEAAALFAPSLIAQYAYDLTKAYNGFYQSESIFQADTPERSNFRVQLSIFVGNVLESALRLLGIDAPHQM
jgi:arginyl-tRNA synthetase